MVWCKMPPIAGGSQFDDLRLLRIEQLATLSDEQFAAEVREHQAARWRFSALRKHARKHWRDSEAVLGHGLAPSELAELSHAALVSWERLFTGLEPADGRVTYVFMASLISGGAMLTVVARSGRIRTAIPVEDIARWLNLRGYLVEVTERAHRLGLRH
jgi:hypothetical protein